MEHRFPPHLAHLSHALSQRDFYVREHFRHISNLFNPKVKPCWQVSSSHSGQREASFWGSQSRTEAMPCEPGAQPCRTASQLCPAAHQRVFAGNTQQSILMLKSRLKFQFQVNSKFTSEGIFSQVAVSLFILLSCSQVNSLPRIIKPSVGLRDCTIGHTLEDTPGPRRGLRSPSSPSLPPRYKQKLQSCNPTMGISTASSTQIQRSKTHHLLLQSPPWLWNSDSPALCKWVSLSSPPHFDS